MEHNIYPTWSGVNPDALLYDRSYGGVVTVDGMGDPQADYGSGWYSDHHFHYGYLVYAAGDDCTVLSSLVFLSTK